MDHEEHSEKINDWFKEHVTGFGGERLSDLQDALYAYSELGLWVSDVSVRTHLALQIWQVVEVVRKNGFPKELKM